MQLIQHLRTKIKLRQYFLRLNYSPVIQTYYRFNLYSYYLDQWLIKSYSHVDVKNARCDI